MTRFLLPLMLTACVYPPVTRTPPDAAATATDGMPTLFEHMVEHYASITTARDAIVRGHLDVARTELGWMATHSPDPHLSQAGQAIVLSMQQEAAAIHTATTPGEAARALSKTAAWCGRCHTQAGVTVGIDDRPPPQGEGLLPHMMRHRWMVDRLWEGLIGPSDDAWKRGADALLAEQSLTQAETPHVDGRDLAVDTMARFVHEAGWTAQEAVSTPERATMLGDLLAACADCHAESRSAGYPMK